MTDRTPDLATLLAHADWLHLLGQQLCRDAHGAADADADAAQDALLSTLHSAPLHAGNVRGYLARTLRNLLGLQTRSDDQVAVRRQCLRGALGAQPKAEAGPGGTVPVGDAGHTGRTRHRRQRPACSTC